MGYLILVGIFLIIWGLLCLFARDLLWSLTRFSYRMEGIASERTELWDTRIAIGGVISIILGLVFICWLTTDPLLRPHPVPTFSPTIEALLTPRPPTPSPTASPSPTVSPSPTAEPLPPMVLAEYTDEAVLLHFVAPEGETTVPAEGVDPLTRFQVVGDRVYYHGRYATRDGVSVLPVPEFPGTFSTLVALSGDRIAWLFLDNQISLADGSGEARFRLVLTDGVGGDPHLVWEHTSTFDDNRGFALLAWRADGAVLYLSQPRLGVAWCCFGYNPGVMALDVATGEVALLGDEDAYDAAVSPDGAWLAQSYDGGEVRLLSLADGTGRAFPGGEENAVAGGFSFSPQGRWLAWLERTPQEVYRLWALRLPDGEPVMVWEMEESASTGEPHIAGWLGPDEVVVVRHEPRGPAGSSYRLRLPDGKPERFSPYDFLGVLSLDSDVLLPISTLTPTPFPDEAEIVRAVLERESRVAHVIPGSFTAPDAEGYIALVAGIGDEDEVRWVVVGRMKGEWRLLGASPAVAWGFDVPPTTFLPPDLTDFDHDGQQELLVHTFRLESGVMASADALYRWDGQEPAQIWHTETLWDERKADPEVVHEPYRILRRVEWHWEDVDGDGVDEIRRLEHVAYYELGEGGYVPDEASPFKEEEQERIYRWNGTAFEP